MSDALLKVKVIPNASREQVVGWLEDVLKIKLQVPSGGGKVEKRIRH